MSQISSCCNDKDATSFQIEFQLILNGMNYDLMVMISEKAFPAMPSAGIFGAFCAKMVHTAVATDVEINERSHAGKWIHSNCLRVFEMSQYAYRAPIYIRRQIHGNN